MLLLFNQNLATGVQPEPEPEQAPLSTTVGSWGGRRVRRLPDVEVEAGGVSLEARVGACAVSVAEPAQRISEPAPIVADAASPSLSLSVGASSVHVVALPDIEAEAHAATVRVTAGVSSPIVDMPTRRADVASPGLSLTCGVSAVKRRWYVSAHRADKAAKPWRLGDVD